VASLGATLARRPFTAKRAAATQREPEPPASRPVSSEPVRSEPRPELEPSHPGLVRSTFDAGPEGLDEPPLIPEHDPQRAHRQVSPPIVEEAPLPSSAEPGSDAPRVRHVEHTVVSRWQHPGLCATNDEGPTPTYRRA
jgi:hypothetical protein